MKKVEVIIRPEKLDDMKEILDECSTTGAMVSNIMGYGNQKGYKSQHHNGDYFVNLLPKLKVETVVSDDVCEKLSLIHISEPTRRTPISYAVFCLKKKNNQKKKKKTKKKK